ncbi:hypothetical protein SK128_000321 [Halocaridina rubra]|uniref:MADF domain-containing protein n=1 Tax=Halocaridina rubra TaxID=373956 RepID=A0AAN9A3L3_HALRR
MDVENLISSIHAVPAIWDSFNPRHGDRTYIAKQWRRISEKLGVSEGAAKKKYKILRDQFRIELRKVPVGKNPDDPNLPVENYLSTWAFFKMLFFLRDPILGRKRCHKLFVSDVECDVDEEDLSSSEHSNPTPAAPAEQETEFSLMDLIHSDGSGVTSNNNENLLTKRLKRETSYAESFEKLDVKRMKPETIPESETEFENARVERKIAEEEDDACRHFLMSLLPYMKKMEPSKQCLFRIKVQELVYNMM